MRAILFFSSGCGLLSFAGMYTLQGEARCEALEGLKIISNMFLSASYLDGSKHI